LTQLLECAAKAGVDYLPSGPVQLGEVSFVGQTGWFDYTLRNVHQDAHIPLEAYKRKHFGKLRWNDGVHVRFTEGDRVLDDGELAAWMEARLRADLARAAAGPKIAVTHLLPFRELVLVRGAMPWDFLNGFMGSRGLGEVIAADPEVRYVISGHTHTRRRARIERAGAPALIAQVSPIGYPREYGGDVARRVRQRVSMFNI
jgi:hypothetical protein